ncbi:MAG TPA: DUF222 domain-containing protein [Mycobacterium sp.]|nr:DUF222 domain-containing protein [Mycobacterium sp.]
MFDTLLPGPEALADAADGVLVAAITGWARVEAAAAARRLAAIAELVHRRTAGGANRSRWSCDYWDGAAAEVAAASHSSHGMASSQMSLAVALRDRLPQVGELLAEGTITVRLASAIAWHTTLVDDEETLGRVDAELAEAATELGPLSANKAADAIDVLVDRHDPAAVRRTRANARGRDVVVDTDHVQAGTSSLWGRLYAVDAALLDRRLTELANGVCDDDPRTIAQRRADALGALAAGAETLACGCGTTECPARSRDGRAASVVIHVVAEAAALEARPDPHMSGECPAAPPTAANGVLITPRAPEPDPPAVHSPAVIVDGGIVPAPLLAELIAGGAKTTPLWLPADMPAEPGYRPSAALAAFIRARDLTCRFPGCDRPAVYCDIDHGIPYPVGPTHPSNLRCKCRKHHLLKTFWTGPDGWSDRQLPDGTIIWTAPSGHTYTTHPGSRLLFPSLCLPTGEISAKPPPQNPPGLRGVMMPLRKRTREQGRAQRIKTERARNADHVAKHNKAPPF